MMVTNLLGHRMAKSWDALVVIFFFILATIIKFQAFDIEYPRVFFDELTYKLDAMSIARGQAYYDPVYPPIYPLTLAPAFFTHSWYQSIIFINALLSSSIIFPTWALARKLLSRTQALAPALVSLILPSQVIYTSYLLSENISSTLFTWCLALVLLRDKNHWWSIIFGVSLSLLFLTKYLYAPIVGLLFFLNIVFDFAHHKNFPSHLHAYSKKVSLIILAGVTCFLPFLVYTGVSGYPLAESIGSHAATENRVLRSLPELAMWFTLYLCYFILSLGPILFLSTQSIRGALTDSRKNFIIIAILTSLLSILMAAVHSWSAWYNHPEPLYLIGRYLVHLVPTYVVIAFAELARSKIKSPSRQLSFYLAIAAVLLFSKQLLYDNLAWTLPSWFADISFNSPSTYVLSKKFEYKIAFYLVSIGIIHFVLKKHTKAIYFATATALVFFLLIENLAIYQLEHRQPRISYHAKQLLSVIPSDGNQNVFIDSKLDLDFVILKYAVTFWDQNRQLDFHNFDPNQAQDGYLLSESTPTIQAAIMQYTYHQSSFSIYPLQGK